MSKVSNSELNRRWQAARQAMEERELDFLIAQSNIAIFDGYVRWFTDISVDDGYTVTVIFPRNEEMTIITHGPAGTIQPTNISGVKKQINTPMLPVLANSYLIADSVVSEVDTHWHSQWHFTVQASLDLNPGVIATLHTL